MKGTLHKTESSWQVWYHAKEDLFYGNTGVRILPILDHGYVNGPGLSDSDEGQEVEFEIVDEIIDLGRHGSTVVEKAKLVHNWLTMKEGEGWDKIMAESGSWDDSEILAYIIKNYNPPTKKQDNE